MLISVKHNFIMQKVAKTASCSMELALRPHLDPKTDTATEIDDIFGNNINRTGPHKCRTHEPARTARSIAGTDFWNRAFTHWLDKHCAWFEKPGSAPGQGTVGCWSQIAIDDKIVVDFIGRYETWRRIGRRSFA